MAQVFTYNKEKQWLSSLFRRFGPGNITIENRRHKITAFIFDKEKSKKVIIAWFDQQRQLGKILERRSKPRKPATKTIKQEKTNVRPKHLTKV